MSHFNILFMDDDRKRFDDFRMCLDPSITTLHTDTTYDTQAALSEHSFDIITLDHDMKFDTPKKTENGDALVDWISENETTLHRVLMDSLFIIHSHNSFGASYMYDVLDRVCVNMIHIIPFKPSTLSLLIWCLLKGRENEFDASRTHDQTTDQEDSIRTSNINTSESDQRAIDLNNIWDRLG
jgi:hypothetical protein